MKLLSGMKLEPIRVDAFGDKAWGILVRSADGKALNDPSTGYKNKLRYVRSVIARYEWKNIKPETIDKFTGQSVKVTVVFDAPKVTVVNRGDGEVFKIDAPVIPARTFTHDEIVEAAAAEPDLTGTNYLHPAEVQSWDYAADIAAISGQPLYAVIRGTHGDVHNKVHPSGVRERTFPPEGI